ncbi:MAG: AAA family ATPase [Gammaproteobacteria bacterium]
MYRYNYNPSHPHPSVVEKPKRQLFYLLSVLSFMKSAVVATFAFAQKSISMLATFMLIIFLVGFFTSHPSYNQIIGNNLQTQNSTEDQASNNNSNTEQPNNQDPVSNIQNINFPIVLPEDININLSHLGGLHETKEEIQGILHYIKNYDQYKKLGANPPKGIMLFGPPGTGKTMLVRAFAKEANLKLIATSGSDFANLWIGGTSERIRMLFKKARANAPCIVFIDEIDAIARKRNNPNSSTEYDNAVNQFLAEMDGVLDKQTGKGIILIGATNNYEVLDPALLRPGRFDKHLYFSLPNLKEREEVLKVHLKNKPTSNDINIGNIAKTTIGFSAADLQNIVNEAAIFSAKNHLEKINNQALNLAAEKVILGQERKTLHLTPQEKEIIAYHEAGHALVAHFLKTNPLNKVTIIPRKMSLGLTSFLPEERQLMNKKYLEHQIAVALGGRIAEEILLGRENVTNGASDDFRVATNIARDMVTVYGFSSLGPINLSKSKDKSIDDEISKIILNNKALATDILKKQKNALDALAKALLESETLENKEILEIIKKHKN